jgi:hypothetical protein
MDKIVGVVIAGSVLLGVVTIGGLYYVGKSLVGFAAGVEAKDFPREDMTIPQFKKNCAMRGGKLQELGQGNYACVFTDKIAHMDVHGKVAISSK